MQRSPTAGSWQVPSTQLPAQQSESLAHAPDAQLQQRPERQSSAKQQSPFPAQLPPAVWQQTPAVHAMPPQQSEVCRHWPFHPLHERPSQEGALARQPTASKVRKTRPIDVPGRSTAQYSPLITKNEPRIVPASFDFCLANLKRSASSAGTSMPSDSLKPTARFFLSSIVYSTLIDRPLS